MTMLFARLERGRESVPTGAKYEPVPMPDATLYPLPTFRQTKPVR
jgi:hypothetical protein